MKFTIQRSEAAEAVKMCLGAVTGRTTLPILSCVLITTKDGELSLIATDLDRWIEVRVPAEVKKQGAIAIGAKLLSGVLSKGGTEANFEVDAKHKAKIVCGGSTFRISGLPPSEFPPPEVSGATDTFVLPASEWLAASKNVAWAVSDDANRLPITGVFLTERNGGFRMVATDGRRLSMTTMEETPSPVREVIVPADTASLIESIADDGGEMKVSLNDSLIVAECGARTVTSKLVAASFPNYIALFPGKRPQATHFKVSAADLLDAVDRISLVIDPQIPAVHLDISEGRIVVSGGKTDADATCEVEAEIEGPAAKLKVNPRFLAEPLRRWNVTEIDIETDGDTAPVIMRAGHLEYLLMPIRL